MKLRRIEEAILAQKGKQDYIKLGHQNNAFFYACLKTRQARGPIQGLMNDQGNTIIDQDCIRDLLISYYDNILGSSFQNEAANDVVSLQDAQSDGLPTLRPVDETKQDK